MVTDGRARRLTGAAVGRTAPAERDLRVGALRSSMRLALVSSGAHSPAVMIGRSPSSDCSDCVQNGRSGRWFAACGESGLPVTCQCLADPGRGCSGGPGGDLAAVAEAELGEDVLDMVFRGSFGDVEQVGDLAVGEAASDQLGDFALAPREAAGPGVAGPQGLVQVPGIGSQAPHAKPGRAADSIVCQDERFGTVLPPAAPGQD